MLCATVFLSSIRLSQCFKWEKHGEHISCLENSLLKKRKQLSVVHFDHQNANSLCVLCVMETWLLTNQEAYFLRAFYQNKINAVFRPSLDSKGISPRRTSSKYRQSTCETTCIGIWTLCPLFKVCIVGILFLGHWLLRPC